MKRVQDEKRATRKKCNPKRGQQQKSAIRTDCNMKQHENK